MPTRYAHETIIYSLFIYSPLSLPHFSMLELWLIILQGDGVQLYIAIWDADPSNHTVDDLIDTLSIDHNESVGKVSTTQTHSGMYEFVSMELIITVTCVERFQGPDCSQCVPGFTGPDCQQIDDCVGVACSGNGSCVDGTDSFSCKCSAGYTGTQCEVNIDDCVAVNYGAYFESKIMVFMELILSQK